MVTWASQWYWRIQRQVQGRSHASLKEEGGGWQADPQLVADIYEFRPRLFSSCLFIGRHGSLGGERKLCQHLTHMWNNWVLCISSSLLSLAEQRCKHFKVIRNLTRDILTWNTLFHDTHKWNYGNFVQSPTVGLGLQHLARNADESGGGGGSTTRPSFAPLPRRPASSRPSGGRGGWRLVTVDRSWIEHLILTNEGNYIFLQALHIFY